MLRRNDFQDTFLIFFKEGNIQESICGILPSVEKQESGISAYTYPPTLVHMLDYALTNAKRTPKKKKKKATKRLPYEEKPKLGGL